MEFLAAFRKYPVSKNRLPDVVLMLGQRRRRLTSIKPILGQCLLLAGQEVLSTMAWQTAMSTILQTRCKRGSGV